jgi:hypothetical protein
MPSNPNFCSECGNRLGYHRLECPWHPRNLAQSTAEGHGPPQPTPPAPKMPKRPMVEFVQQALFSFTARILLCLLVWWLVNKLVHPISMTAIVSQYCFLKLIIDDTILELTLKHRLK